MNICMGLNGIDNRHHFVSLLFLYFNKYETVLPLSRKRKNRPFVSPEEKFSNDYASIVIGNNDGR